MNWVLTCTLGLDALSPNDSMLLPRLTACIHLSHSSVDTPCKSRPTFRATEMFRRKSKVVISHSAIAKDAVEDTSNGN